MEKCPGDQEIGPLGHDRNCVCTRKRKDDAQIQVQNIPMLLGRVEHLSFNPKMRCFVFHYQKCGMVEKDERQLLAYTEELLQTMQECLTVQPCHS